jgi:sterol desaturase/sphingolipid hydroxylase (fatty acid hydroxylase superfamily)
MTPLLAVGTEGKTVSGVFIGFAVLSLLFFLIERVFGRGRKQRVFRRGWTTDFIYWILKPIVVNPIVRYTALVPVLILVFAKVVDVHTFQLGSYAGYGPVSRQPVWLQLIEIYLVADLVGYWTHRLFHQGKWWPFHAVHHSSEELDWLGSVRVHPVNDAVDKFAQVTPFLLLGFNPLAAASSAVFFTLYAIFLHANVNWDFGPLRSVIATPVFHRWHHSKDREAWDKNFAGLLPMWDILFGTYYMPKGRYPENFGICEPMPRGFFGQMWEPFAWLRRRARKVDPAPAAVVATVTPDLEMPVAKVAVVS